MMTVFFSHDVKSAGAAVKCLLATEDGQKVVNEGLNLVILDVRH